MTNQILTDVRTDVKTQFIATPAFDLDIYTDQAYVEVEEEAFSQSTTFPANRDNATYTATPVANFDHPARHMSLAERVELMRGPAEDGID